MDRTRLDWVRHRPSIHPSVTINTIHTTISTIATMASFILPRLKQGKSTHPIIPSIEQTTHLKKLTIPLHSLRSVEKTASSSTLPAISQSPSYPPITHHHHAIPR
jgi:hypothetical protein